jgi:hypothetical protein
MNTIFILAEIMCFETARKWIKFPIINSFRLSIWFKDAIASTPSEVQLQDESIDILKPCIVQIAIMDRDFLQGKIEVGEEFTLGTNPIRIISGKILEIIKIEK